jgi:hypothetical protein
MPLCQLTYRLETSFFTGAIQPMPALLKEGNLNTLCRQAVVCPRESYVLSAGSIKTSIAKSFRKSTNQEFNSTQLLCKGVHLSQLRRSANVRDSLFALAPVPPPTDNKWALPSF